MTRAMLTGMLLLLPVGVVAACGDAGSSGADVPAGYKRVDSDGMRFIVPAALPVGKGLDPGQLFMISPPGTPATEPRVAGARGTAGHAQFRNDVLNARDVNTAPVEDFTPVSDGRIDVPGSDEAYRVVSRFKAGEKFDIPTTEVLIAARRGTAVYQLEIVVPDAKRASLDADLVARSLEIT
jgi:hypothetical protein